MAARRAGFKLVRDASHAARRHRDGLPAGRVRQVRPGPLVGSSGHRDVRVCSPRPPPSARLKDGGSGGQPQKFCSLSNYTMFDLIGELTALRQRRSYCPGQPTPTNPSHAASARHSPIHTRIGFEF